MSGYLKDKDNLKCFGCEACVQICASKSISLCEDHEGFRYPVIDKDQCSGCGLCETVCPYDNMPERFSENKYVFGGYNKNGDIRFESTSGGAFSAIVESFCDENYVVFGAEANGTEVFHSYTENKNDISKYRKSKYSQSKIGTAYSDAKKFLRSGKKVLFSGTPCQIAGLKAFLKNTDQTDLLTVEVICEGVPSPLYIRKYEEFIIKKYCSRIKSLDYRYTGKGILSKGKWDFEIMRTELADKEKVITVDRWFNPFWSVWLKHLMSRPSCYECPFAVKERVADISLGDLWGVHLYCPELYGSNGGASLIVANTPKGTAEAKKAERFLNGHELRFEDALRYQSPMRKHIDSNADREKFMNDLESSMKYEEINNKWAKKPDTGLLFQKYIWGNRQKILLWNLKKKFNKKEK